MKRYTITQMADKFNVNRMQVVRLIERLGLKEVNTDRPHANSPKYYDEKVYKRLRAELHEQHSPEQEHDKINDSYASNEVVELLKSQLEHERERVKEVSARNKELISLIDQQQRLSLIYNDKVKALEVELKEVKEPLDNKSSDPLDDEVTSEPKESLFNRIFKRSKA